MIALPDGWSIEWLEEVDSTNEHLKRGSYQHGHVVVADRQTHGRGRRGAVWHSEPGGGLAFSVMLRPSEPRGLWPRLALAAGLAVAEGLGRLGIEAGVKWPNDVWIGDKKVAGILVEAVPEGAIVGIGLNVGTREFPEDISNTATSLWLADRVDRTREEVLEILLPPLAAWSARIGRDFGELLGSLRERCVLTGRAVTLDTAAGSESGVVRGIGDHGELLLESSDGIRPILQADQVRIT
ncbi:biotin--[acetyl-CoA-carboxylase] ligase [Haloferula helveola]|uniref:Biotin--[acetyl-CoA-carboxylase] ligase n=1 Tax=Haloferula helveola TaxID=490095 RepID=A0ABM7RER5_9BACT|nr:biotin--[acetyl-CoA-carboxylase] ligase [Haloferula helveola]